MATTKIVDIIERCEIITQDKTSVRWPQSEWLKWYNDAILFVVNQRPDKSVKNTSVVVDIANTKQSLPDDGTALVTVTRNIATGRPIRQINRNQLDDQYDDWHNQIEADIDHFVYDPRDPTSFYIYPRPITVGHEVEITYNYTPIATVIADFEADTTTIGVDDSFVNPLIDFMLYRAYSKDADYAENGQRAKDSYMSAQQAISNKTQADTAMIPKENRNA